MAVTVADLLVRFAADTSGLDTGLSNANQKLNIFQQTSGGMLSSLQSVGTFAGGVALAGVAALGAGMVATAVDGTKMAADLQSQVSGIGAVLGKSADELKPLKDAILELGINPNLKVSTLEAADAMEMLARNGLNMEQIIGGAAEATVLLSNATGGDFSQAADIMTDAMAIFGESAGSYQDAVNGVVSVTNASKFSVDDYALALAQAGGVAGSVGVEFDDFNTAIAAMSPLFGSGSDAGTSFKTMLSRLVPGSKDAEATMRDLGLMTVNWSDASTHLEGVLGHKVAPTLEGVQAGFKEMSASMGGAEEGTKKYTEAYSRFVHEYDQNMFFDANGQLKDMADISGLLQTSLADLSEEQKNQALQTIFGSDAMRAAVGLAKVGKDGFADLQAQMGQTDAIESAATRMDNAAGAMEILGGVVETVKIQIGDAFLPILKELATQLGGFVDENSGNIVAFFNQFAVGVGYVASFIPGLVTGLFDLIGVVSGVVQVISEYIQSGELLSASEFGLSESIAAVVDSVTGFIANVIDAVAAVAAFIQPIIATIAQFVSWQDIMTTLGIAIAAVIIPAIASFVVAMVPIIATVALVIAVIAFLRNAWENDWGGIQEKTAAVWDWLKGAFEAIKDWMAEKLPGYLEQLQDAWATAWPIIQEAFSVVWDFLVEAWDAIVVFFTDTLPGALNSLRNAWQTGWNVIKSAFTTAYNGISAVFETLKTWFTETIPTAITDFKTSVDTTFESIKTSIATKLNTVIGVFISIKTWLTETLQDAMDTFKNSLSGITFSNPFQSIVDAVGKIPTAFTNAKTTIANFVSWLTTLRVPDIFSILNLPDWLTGYVGGGGKSAPGRSALSGASTTLALSTTGGAGFDVDTLAAAIVRAFASSPPVVRAEFTVNTVNDPGMVDVSYAMARRVSEIIQRRTT